MLCRMRLPSVSELYIIILMCFCPFTMYVDRDMKVAIATSYGLDGPEIEYRWGREFPYTSRLALGSRSLLHNGDRVLFPG